MTLPQLDDYRQLFLNDTPMLDVRAPSEFAQGAFPQAQNIPLMSDEERHLVGLRYKEAGQQHAIQLGHELVHGEIKASRVADWVRFSEQHPQGALYCFRGGLRSQISQQWLYDATGVRYPRIIGGYKALRRFLIDELALSASQLQPVILGGRTGSGKTRFLNQLQRQIDLEGIFHHRGSAFGKYASAQPSQINIENRLAISLLKFRQQQIKTLLIEDEAASIGSRRVPTTIHEVMQRAPVVLLEVPFAERVENIFDEYIHVALDEHQQLHGEQAGFESWASNLQQALANIERRLGGQRHLEIKQLMDDAIQQQRTTTQTESHKQWIARLLTDYYDPMYDYQLEKKAERIVYRGEHDSLLAYLDKAYQVR